MIFKNCRHINKEDISKNVCAWQLSKSKKLLYSITLLNCRWNHNKLLRPSKVFKNHTNHKKINDNLMMSVLPKVTLVLPVKLINIQGLGSPIWIRHLADRNMQVRFGLQVIWEFWVGGIWLMILWFG